MNTDKFLSFFEPELPFVFQSKDDGKGTKKKSIVDKYGKVWHKTGHYDFKIHRWLKNNNNDHWGCFFTVNEIDQSRDPEHKRTEPMLTRIRAVWVEDDEEHDAPREDWPIPPSLIVNSSPGKYHYYWLTDLDPTDENKEEWKGVMQGMVDHHGCDNNAKDLVRVLRLPGFYHMKDPDNPHLVTAKGEGQPYPWDAIREAFPPSGGVTRGKGLSVGGGSDGKDVAGLIEDYENGHRHGPSSRMAMKLANGKLTKDDIIKMLCLMFPDNSLDHHKQSASSAVEKIRAEKKGEENGPGLRIAPTDILAYIPPINYVVRGILPRCVTSLLGGHGGSGKTLLAAVLAAHVACGHDWAGLSVVKGKVLLVTLEDPPDIIRRRLLKISNAYSLPHDVINENVKIVDGSDGATLAHESRGGVLELTTAYEKLCEMSQGYSLVIIDNASDAFAANENIRMLVRRFIQSLTKIARDNDAAVLLLAHIDKAAAKYGSNGNSYSGSTAWHNSVRSRMALLYEKDDDRPVLNHEKANLCRRIEPITLGWSDDGVLMPVDEGSLSAFVEDDEANVLAAIAAAIRDGDNVPCGRSGPSTTLNFLSKYPDLSGQLKEKKNSKRFWNAITKLQRDGKIKKEEYTTDSRNKTKRWIICD